MSELVLIISSLFGVYRILSKFIWIQSRLRFKEVYYVKIGQVSIRNSVVKLFENLTWRTALRNIFQPLPVLLLTIN